MKLTRALQQTNPYNLKKLVLLQVHAHVRHGPPEALLTVGRRGPNEMPLGSEAKIV